MLLTFLDAKNVKIFMVIYLGIDNHHGGSIDVANEIQKKQYKFV